MSCRTFLLLSSLLFTASLLSACATQSIDEERPGVREAKACQEAKDTHPGMNGGLVIKACTNNGIWLADQYDDNGMLLKRFDFVNKEYAGPETGGGFVSVESLGEDSAQKFSDLRGEINAILAKS